MKKTINDRHKAILEIVQNQSINSQEDLVKALDRRGISVAQATLSRDLRALDIVKRPGKGYSRQNSASAEGRQNNTGNISIEFSGQLAVIKASLGYAPAIAARIDGIDCPQIMGSLAGDDTVLLILRQGFTPVQVLAWLDPILPGIKVRNI